MHRHGHGAVPGGQRPAVPREIVEGKDQVTYRIAPLEPGEYYFEDEAHPVANGVLVVE